MNKKTMLTYGITTLLVIISFVAGMQTGKSRNTNKAFGNRNIPNGMNQNFNKGTGMNIRSGASNIMGEVLSKDENSLTIKSKTGSKIVIVSKSTEVFKTITGSIADIAVGTNVVITGKEGDGNSTVADSIRIVDKVTMPQLSPTKQD